MNLGFGSAAVEPLLLSDTSLTPLLGGIHLNDSGKVDRRDIFRFEATSRELVPSQLVRGEFQVKTIGNQEMILAANIVFVK